MVFAVLAVDFEHWELYALERKNEMQRVGLFWYLDCGYDCCWDLARTSCLIVKCVGELGIQREATTMKMTMKIWRELGIADQGESLPLQNRPFYCDS